MSLDVWGDLPESWGGVDLVTDVARDAAWGRVTYTDPSVTCDVEMRIALSLAYVMPADAAFRVSPATQDEASSVPAPTVCVSSAYVIREM